MNENCWEEDQYQGMTQQPEAAAEVPKPDSSGLVQAVEVIAGGPEMLLTQAVNPGSTSLPMGLAILGACVVAVIAAAKLGESR